MPHRRMPLLTLVCMLAFGCGGRAARTAATPPKDVPHVAVMTFNVNFGMAGDPPTVDAVAQNDADVIFLQETTSQWEAALRAQFAQTYPNMAFKQWPPAGGLAVLSKCPIETIDYLPAKSWLPAARVVLQRS